MGKIFSKYLQPWIQPKVSKSSTGLYQIMNHSNQSDLCEVLKIQNFVLSEGPRLSERLNPTGDSNKFGNIEKKLYCLLGNGRDKFFTIPQIVNELLLRNYPEFLAFNGSSKMVIFVPEWYLTKAVKYIEPSRGPQLQEFSDQASNACPERKRYFEVEYGCGIPLSFR